MAFVTGTTEVIDSYDIEAKQDLGVTYARLNPRRRLLIELTLDTDDEATDLTEAVTQLMRQHRTKGKF